MNEAVGAEYHFSAIIKKHVADDQKTQFTVDS